MEKIVRQCALAQQRQQSNKIMIPMRWKRSRGLFTVLKKLKKIIYKRMQIFVGRSKQIIQNGR